MLKNIVAPIGFLVRFLFAPRIFDVAAGSRNSKSDAVAILFINSAKLKRHCRVSVEEGFDNVVDNFIAPLRDDRRLPWPP